MQQEEAAEEKALPCARKLAGDNKDKKKSNWGRPLARSVAAPPSVPLPTTPLLTLLVAPERERQRGGRRRERDSGQPWWSVNESTNDD